MKNVNENNINEFLGKITEDDDFAEKVFSTQNPEDVQALAKAAKIDLTIEDIFASKDIIHSAIDQAREGELSEADLDNVAGGFGADTVVKVGGMLLKWAVKGGSKLIELGIENNWKW